MTKLREVADKLGLQIGKVFKIDNIKSLVFRIDDEGNVLFYHEEKECWIQSAWSLVDVYVVGYTLIDWIKPTKNDIGLASEEYFKGILNILNEYNESLEEEFIKTQSVFEIQENKDTRNIIKMLINETKKKIIK